MTYDDDCEHEDNPCPKCGEYEVRSRCCDVINCDDGYCDEHDDDPINFGPGEEFTMCRECYGTGHLRWCSKCGCDIGWKAYKERGGE